MNETVCPSTLKFPRPSNDLLPVSHDTLANTKANGNQNSDNVMDPIIENVTNETVRLSTLKFPPPSNESLLVTHGKVANTHVDGKRGMSKRSSKVVASKVGAIGGTSK